jgi:hypothetical protein
MGMAEIGGQGQHMAPDVVTTRGTSQQDIGREGMPQIDQSWLRAPRCTGHTRRSQQAREGGVDGRTTEGTSPKRHEHMLICRGQLCTLDQVRLKRRAGGRVQGH